MKVKIAIRSLMKIIMKIYLIGKIAAKHISFIIVFILIITIFILYCSFPLISKYYSMIIKLKRFNVSSLAVLLKILPKYMMIVQVLCCRIELKLFKMDNIYTILAIMYNKMIIAEIFQCLLKVFAHQA